MGATGVGLVGICVWRIWKGKWRWGDRPPADIAFRDDGSRDFRFRLFRSNCPVGMGQSQAHGMGYFLILPFLWSDIIGRWVFPERAVMCPTALRFRLCQSAWRLSVGHPGFD